jgi:hypothetical protein
MANPKDPQPARRDSWKISALPEKRVVLDFAAHYSQEEFQRLQRGLIPEAMEDKWFIFHEQPWLYFHRSWTGYAIYGLRLERSASGFDAAEAWASRDAAQYTESDTGYDAAMLKFLIDALLLDKPANFPAPGSLGANVPSGIFQHASVGRTFRQPVIEQSQERHGMLNWLKRLLGFR